MDWRRTYIVEEERNNGDVVVKAGVYLTRPFEPDKPICHRRIRFSEDGAILEHVVQGPPRKELGPFQLRTISKLHKPAKRARVLRKCAVLSSGQIRML